MANRTKASEQLSEFSGAKKVRIFIKLYLRSVLEGSIHCARTGYSKIIYLVMQSYAIGNIIMASLDLS